MDKSGSPHTKLTQLMVRAEHIALVLVLMTLAFLHTDTMAWGRFLATFVLIDLVGYLPGAISFRLARGGKISPVYHYLYNFAHSYLTTGFVVGVWGLTIGHLEWAMLALPIHLSSDRGLFGNTYKPASLPFEVGTHWTNVPRSIVEASKEHR